MKVLKNTGMALVLQLSIYLLQYVAIPIVYMPHPMDQTVSTLIVCVTTFGVVFFGQYWLVGKVRYWLISFPIYPLLVKVYHPTNIYGIGYDGFLISFNENFGIFIFATLVFIVEVLTCLIVHLIKRLQKKH